MPEINPLSNDQIFLKKIAENTGSDYNTGDVSEINPLTIDQILLKEIAANTAGQSGDITELEEKVTANAEAIEAIVNEYGAKNIIPFPYVETFPKEFAGVTFTCDKGKVLLNGTNTYEGAYTFALVAKSNTVFGEASNALPIFTHDGTYIISNGTYARIQINIYRNGSLINTMICTDTEIQFDVLSTDTVEIGIPVSAGETFTNVMCCPMIRDSRISDNTWVPYSMTNRELTERMILVDIPINSISLSAGETASLIISGVVPSGGYTPMFVGYVSDHGYNICYSMTTNYSNDNWYLLFQNTTNSGVTLKGVAKVCMIKL